MPQKRSAEEIERILKDLQASGLTRAEYCRRQGIPITTMDYYQRRRMRKASGRLVKVTVKAEPVQSHSVFTLALANGRRIESNWSFSDADLLRLIRIAEAG